jgi:23S rRNA (guanosine2251-2'-O)-methyltransferase
MWGVHAVEAALKMGRHVYELYYLPQKADQFQSFGGKSVSVQQLEKFVPKGVVHQGVVLCAGPAPTATLDTLSPEKGTVLVLDQIVDPHNLGALWRSAAAFGVQAVVIPEDRSSSLCGVVAKAASGALEYVPCVRVTNLARALEQLKKQGFFVVGLDESGQELNPRVTFLDIGVALVVGREDKGMRPLTQSHCDVVWKLSVSPQFSTLNASVAGAVALSQVYAK